MADPIGASFVPGADQQTPGINLTGGQKPIQMLNLRMPKVVGAQAIAPQNLLNERGPQSSPDLSSAVVRSVLAAMGLELPGASSTGANLGGAGASAPIPGPGSLGMPSTFSSVTRGAGPAAPTPPMPAPPSMAQPSVPRMPSPAPAMPTPPPVAPLPQMPTPAPAPPPSVPTPFAPRAPEPGPVAPTGPMPGPIFHPDVPASEPPPKPYAPPVSAGPMPTLRPPPPVTPDFQGLLQEAIRRVGGGSDWNSYKGLAGTDPFVQQFTNAFGAGADWNALRPR